MSGSKEHRGQKQHDKRGTRGVAANHGFYIRT